MSAHLLAAVHASRRRRAIADKEEAPSQMAEYMSIYQDMMKLASEAQRLADEVAIKLTEM